MKNRKNPALAALIAATTVFLAPVSRAQKAEDGEKKASGYIANSPAQASIAAKTKFATLPASSPLVAKALDATDFKGAQKQIGKEKEAAFKGTVTRVFAMTGNSIVLVNFAADYKTALVAALKPPAYAKFPDMKVLQGKRVLITGKVVDYRDRPEIELASPSQIKIIVEK